MIDRPEPTSLPWAWPDWWLSRPISHGPFRFYGHLVCNLPATIPAELSGGAATLWCAGIPCATARYAIRALARRDA